LERFARGDEAAFELLVWRHGPLVLGACRRVLRHEQDAEDAFQAAFLTLARKAGGIGRRGPLAGWLCAVASRLALRARERRGRETDLERPPSAAPADLSPLLVRGAVRLARLVAAGAALTGAVSPAALALARRDTLSPGPKRIKRCAAACPSTPRRPGRP
jgi:DNA-directed RNA polymerase specialized sigma24 family protein